MLDLHPEEPTQEHLLPTTTTVPDLSKLSNAVPSWSTKLWRRRLADAAAPKKQISLTTLRQTLRTLMLWVSWIHEDVGHSLATFVYNPVYTPLFVPEDGVGVPAVPYAFAAAAHRDFIFVERPKLLDAPPKHWFGHKECSSSFGVFQSCTGVEDQVCYDDFQEGLKSLNTDAFTQCDRKGFYSCMDRVESSASS